MSMIKAESSSAPRSAGEVFTRGLWHENPVLVQTLGLCSALAVTNAVANSIAMGLATTFVLVGSSVIVSSLRKLIPRQIRITTYILIIATFLAIADMLLEAIVPEVHKAMGPYIALIITNCIVLGRQEAFASRQPVRLAVLDALGNGGGFTVALLLMGIPREVLGSGTFLGVRVMPHAFEPWVVMLLPPGGFFMIGALLLAANWHDLRKRARARRDGDRARRGGSSSAENAGAGGRAGMSDFFWTFVSAAVVTNFVLVYFLGLCPVIGVTSRSATGLRLGLATTFVMVLASFAAWVLNTFVLGAAPYLRVIAFVVSIASIVQIVELFVKKVTPALYRELGIFLPLIASNSQVLGMTIFQTSRGYSLPQGLAFALGAGLGITAVLSLVGGIRERMAFAPIPAVARGPALVFIIVAALSLVFMGFAGMGTA